MKTKTKDILGTTLRVPNKYNLTMEDLKKHLVLKDRSKVGEPRFWRNNVINAYCISVSAGPYLSADSFWLGIHDKLYNGKIVRCYFDSFGGMCSYDFEKFYDPSDIENQYDLEIQEKALEILNGLIDDGILGIERK